MSRRDTILERAKGLPQLPATAVQAVQMLQDPGAEMSALVRALELDPGLTTDILRYANSATMGGDRSVDSVQQALVRLGFVRVLQIVLTATVGPMAQTEVKGYDLSSGELWQHSVVVAICAECIQKHLDLPADRSVFTAGLLHDIGRIVLATLDDEAANEIARTAFEQGKSFDTAENEILGIDHAELGSFLLEEWKLPAHIVEVVRWHHDPDAMPEPSLLVDVVHVADNLSIMTGIGIGRDGLQYHTSSRAAERLGINPDNAEEIVYLALAEYDKLKEMFGVAQPV